MKDQQLADFYRQLASMLDAGLPALKAFDSLSREGSLAATVMARKLWVQINDGATIAQAASTEEKIFKPFHIQLIRGGEMSGRLPAVLRKLAEHIEMFIALRRRIITGLIYPAIVLHLAVFVLAVFLSLISRNADGVMEISFNPLKGLTVLLCTLLPIYLITLTIHLIFKNISYTHPLRSFLEAILDMIPIVGKLLRKMALVRFVTVYEALYNAGIGDAEAFTTASDAASHSRLYSKLMSAVDLLKAGEGLDKAFRHTGVFDAAAMSMIETGVQSGHLDEMLLNIARKYEEDIKMVLKLIASLIPVIIFIAIAAVVVFMIFYIFSSYVNMLNSLME